MHHPATVREPQPLCKVTIDGKKAKRKAIKVGMTCTFNYPKPGAESARVDCKG